MLIVDELRPVPDLSKLSDVVKNDVKKTECSTKMKDIEDKILSITNLATNTALNAKINEVKHKVPNITNLATSSALNAKINEFKSKISNITNLATTTDLNAVENKIPDHSKYIFTPEYNKLRAEHITARLKQANLANKLLANCFCKKEKF